MLVILKQVVVLLVFALVGCVMAKKKVINGDQSGMLSTIAVYVFLPCAAFNSFSANFTVEYLARKYPLVLISLAILLALMLLGKVLAKKLQPEGYDRVVYEYSLIIPNTSYMGYPLILSLYGSEAMLDMMMFGIPLTIYCYTIGYDMLTERTGQGFSIKRIMTPVVTAMLLGSVVGLTGLVMPSVVTQVTESAAACLGPAGMLLLGVALAKFNTKDLFVHKSVYVVTAMRLVIIPLMVFAVLKLIRMEYMLLPAIATYAMPCGLNAIVFPQMIGHDCNRGVALVLISTVLSVITVPICIYLFV